MPIRLNLLAEAQALEDQRRRDPVKRTLWVGALLIALMLGWASSLQLKALVAKASLNRLGAKIDARNADYKKVIDTQKKIAEINHRLLSLHSLATNRFLYGNLLNAMQQVVTDDIQLSQIRVDQQFALVEGSKPKTNANKITPGKPATATESIALSFDGSDASASPGDQVAKFREQLAAHPFFQAVLGKTNQVNLKSLSAPTFQPESGRAIVLFALESKLPPKTR